MCELHFVAQVRVGDSRTSQQIVATPLPFLDWVLICVFLLVWFGRVEAPMLNVMLDYVCMRFLGRLSLYGNNCTKIAALRAEYMFWGLHLFVCRILSLVATMFQLSLAARTGFCGCGPPTVQTRTTSPGSPRTLRTFALRRAVTRPFSRSLRPVVRGRVCLFMCVFFFCNTRLPTSRFGLRGQRTARLQVAGHLLLETPRNGRKETIQEAREETEYSFHVCFCFVLS